VSASPLLPACQTEGGADSGGNEFAVTSREAGIRPNRYPATSLFALQHNLSLEFVGLSLLRGFGELLQSKETLRRKGR